MSNCRDSSHHEKQAFNVCNFNPKMPASAQNNNANNRLKVKQMWQKRSEDCNPNLNAKNPWNHIFMQHNMVGQQNEDYKISSSLKTIWNDVSDSRSTSSNHDVDIPRGVNMARGVGSQTPLQQLGNNVMPVENNIQSKDVGSDSAFNLNPNSLKGRAITARYGSCIANLDNGNDAQIYSSTVPCSPQQNQPLEQFLQKVHLIVRNGFLDPKILTEPISPETFDLVQMLIYYIMEYSRTRNYAIGGRSPALIAEIQNIFYKINLIQNEIAKCQKQYVRYQRVQQDIVQSFSIPDGLNVKAQNFNGHSSSSQRRGPTNGKCSQVASSGGCYGSKAEYYERPNQRFNQRQFDQFPLKTNAQHSSARFAFLPKTKNIDKSSPFYEPNRIHSQSDGNLSTN